MDYLPHKRCPTLADPLIVDRKAWILHPHIGQPSQEVHLTSVEILVWLDHQVTKMFRVVPESQIEVPVLVGKSRDEAKNILEKAQLQLGEVKEEPEEEESKIGTVVSQDPLPESLVDKGSKVDIVVAIKKPDGN